MSKVVTTTQNRVNPSTLVRESKKEAKRLLNLAGENGGNLTIGSLSVAQQVVATLKGKASWHELSASSKSNQDDHAIGAPYRMLELSSTSYEPHEVMDRVQVLKSDLGGHFLYITNGHHGMLARRPNEPLIVNDEDLFKGMTSDEVAEALQGYFSTREINVAENGRGQLMSALMGHFAYMEAAHRLPVNFKASLSRTDALNPVSALRAAMYDSPKAFLRYLLAFSGTGGKRAQIWNNQALEFFEPIVAPLWSGDFDPDPETIRQAMSESSILAMANAGILPNVPAMPYEGKSTLMDNWREQVSYRLMQFSHTGWALVSAVARGDTEWISLQLSKEIELLETFREVDTDTLDALQGKVSKDIFLPMMSGERFSEAYLTLVAHQIAKIPRAIGGKDGKVVLSPATLIIEGSVPLEVSMLKRLLQATQRQGIALLALGS